MTEKGGCKKGVSASSFQETSKLNRACDCETEDRIKIAM